LAAIATIPPAATKPAAAATNAPAAAATAVPVAKVKRGGTLRAAVTSEWAPNLDPHSFTGNPFGYELVYDRLVRTDIEAKTGARTIKPGLAESWEQANPKTIVMKLRKDVVFQDGSKFNAGVSKWNLDRMRTWAKSAAKTDVAVIDSLDAIDEYTIRINLKGAPAPGLVGTGNPGASE
jgi:peptide/nickel transport system substrate-binding protein